MFIYDSLIDVILAKCTFEYNGTLNDVLPIYRTFNRKGEYFDYAPIHWGEPVITFGDSNE